jgi:hypothetical protein
MQSLAAMAKEMTMTVWCYLWRGLDLMSNYGHASDQLMSVTFFFLASKFRTSWPFEPFFAALRLSHMKFQTLAQGRLFQFFLLPFNWSFSFDLRIQPCLESLEVYTVELAASNWLQKEDTISTRVTIPLSLKNNSLYFIRWHFIRIRYRIRSHGSPH